MRLSSSSSTSPEIVTIMMGKSSKETSRMSVSSASSGSSVRALLTRSRTRWIASSMTTSGWNSSAMTLAPSAEVLDILFRSLSPASSLSSGTVIRLSMSSGETPIYGVETMTTGMSMSGKDSRGSEA